MVLKSWCVSCHSSPRGCGEPGFLHILLLLQIWRGGAFLSAGEPPSPAPESGSSAQERIQFFVVADGARSRCTPPRRHANVAVASSWATGSLSLGPSLPGMRLPEREMVFLPATLEWVCFAAVCLTGAFGLVLGKGTFSFIKASLCFAGIHKSSFHCGPNASALREGGGGKKGIRTLGTGSSAHSTLSQACAHPCPQR